MMQFAIFGLGPFGRSVAESLRYFDQVQTVVFDRDEKAVAAVREFVSETVLTDLRLRLDIVRHIPENVDVAVIDLGDDTQTAMKMVYLVSTGYQPRKIVVSTPDTELVDIYRKLGATDVIVPSQQAAMRLVPYMISDFLFSYIPVGKNFVMAEIKPPQEFLGKTLRELNLRQRYRLNVVAIRSKEGEYELFEIDRRLGPEENLLVVGSTEHVNQFLVIRSAGQKSKFQMLLDRFFRQK